MTYSDAVMDKPNSRLKTLLLDMRHIEICLDEATKAIEDYIKLNNIKTISQNPNYLTLLQIEKNLSKEWTSVFNSLLNFAPVTIQETSELMTALLDLLSQEHDSPVIVKSLKTLAIEVRKY